MMDKKFVCLCRVKCICFNICEFGQICLFVYCILCYIYVQIISVVGDWVLVMVSIVEKDLCEVVIGNVDVVLKVGELIVKCVKEVGIECVVFDCFGFCYYGWIKVLVDVVCENGFEF